MESIESSSFPLVFLTEPIPGLEPLVDKRDASMAIHTICRALAGMQKEAIVQYGANGRAWRMVCDEGPWLNGTDLAPFPLAFFTAGLLSSYMAEFIAEAGKQALAINSLRVLVDNYYAMEGSAVAGTMAASALPVTITFQVNAEADRDQLLKLSYAASANSAADAYLRNSLQSTFSLTTNEVRFDLERAQPSAMEIPGDPRPLFALARPATATESRPDIIIKRDDPDPGFAAEGAVGLQNEQKRIVHVHGEGVLRRDGMKEISVACIKPAGSVFRFLSDESVLRGGKERAPCGLAYFSAGLAYCFMTQLGRYAQLSKQDLRSYRIAQNTRFILATQGDEPRLAQAEPVETHVYLDSGEDHRASQKLVEMGEQTCYLHAAGRTALRNRVRLETI